MSRDDFTAATKRRLAGRAGYLCAYPGCPHPRTIGAAKSGDGEIILGIAAHITAASPNGPRFDATLTPEQRRHQRNGVWMCAIHGKAIDDDDATFPVELLIKWKTAAEDQSLPNVWTSEVLRGLVEPDEDAPDATQLALLGLPTDTDLGAIAMRASVAAEADLRSFQSAPSWPAEPVLLDLTFEAESERKRFSAEGLATAATAHQSIVVRAPPGVGKTTTLLQAANALLAQDGFIPIFVPLPEWSGQSNSIFAYVADRQAFSRVSEAELRLLATFGRLVVILDGWNELDAVSRRNAAAELDALKRQFPELGLVLSTRRQAMDVPLGGPVVSIEPLTEDQQVRIAMRRTGESGAELLDQIWRTPGVRDLASIPLYLDALLSSATGDQLPTTKEGILRLFVDQHSRVWRRREALNATFAGHEDDFLKALAVAATSAANTAIQTETARNVVSATATRLSADGQFTLQMQPAALLDVLASEHILVSAGASGFGFQHQQFQEWYASFEAERLMVAAAGGDSESRRRLREDVLNWPVWEEAVLFAVERLSRRGVEEATSAAVGAISEALDVDPLLAGEMLFRSAPVVWDRVKSRAIDLANRWHTAGDVDRAVRFMITTGKSDFSEPVWSLIESDTGQRFISVFDVARSFRASVLSPVDRDKLHALPDDQRRHALSELVQRGDIEAITLAVDVTRSDPSAAVKVSVIQACLFRGADRQALALLNQADDPVWEALAVSGWGNEVPDQQARERLKAIKSRQVQNDPTGKARLAEISYEPKDPALGMEARDLLADPTFPATDPTVGSIIGHLHERYPDDVVQALIQRLLVGAKLPFGGHDLIRASGVVIDDGPLAEFVASPGPPYGPENTAAVLAGPRTVARLIQMQLDYAAALARSDQSQRTALYDANSWISARLRSTALSPFVQGVLSRPFTEDLDEIAELAELIAAHGSGDAPGPFQLDGELKAELTGRLLRWAQVYVDHVASVTRYQRDRLVKAMVRLPDERLVPLLIDLLGHEIAQRQRAQAARAANPARPPRGDGGTMSYFQDYRRAFEVIPWRASEEALLAHLADPDFGVEAAQALRTIADREGRAASERQYWTSGPTLAEVEARRRRRESGSEPPPSPHAAAILAVAGKIMASAPDDRAHARALALAAVASQIPHEPSNELVESLLARPGNTGAKLHLLTVRLLVGHRVTSKTVLEGLAELLEVGKRETWRLRLDDNGEVVRWLALLPLTENPASTLDGMNMVKQLGARPLQLRSVISSLAANSSEDAERVLLALPEHDPRFLEDHDWRTALERRGTANPGRALLELAERGPTGLAPRNMALAVASAMADNPTFREEIYRRYLALPYGNAATVLASVISERPDNRAVQVLIQGYAKRGPHFDGMIERAIENLAVGQRASKEWIGATEQVSEPVPELRRMLLAQTVGSGPEASIASVALTVIDALRDRHGLVETEPRHPDLVSGIPWPRVMNQPGG